MIDVEAIVQRYYGDRPVLQRIDSALRAAGVAPGKPAHRDLWPFDQLHSRGIVATCEHAERALIKPGMYVIEIGCGVGGASRYLAAESGCRVAAIDLMPNFVEVARILTARCGLADRVEIRRGTIAARAQVCWPADGDVLWPARRRRRILSAAVRSTLARAIRAQPAIRQG